MQVEINELELEKSKFQHQFSVLKFELFLLLTFTVWLQELELQLRVELEGFERDKEQWREKQIRFLKQLQLEEKTIQQQQEKMRHMEAILKERESVCMHAPSGFVESIVPLAGSALAILSTSSRLRRDK